MGANDLTLIDGPANENFNLTKEEFNKKLLDNENLLAVVDCYADWCPPCKAIAPAIDKMAAEYSNVTFFKINVDKAFDVAQEYGIRSLPTFLIFKNGKKVGEVVGALEKILKAKIDANLTEEGGN